MSDRFDITMFGPMLPEIYLCLATLGLLMYGVFRARTVNATMGFAAALVLVLTVYLATTGTPERVGTVHNMFVSDAFTRFFKALILLSSLMVLILSMRWLLEDGGKPFEFIALLLFATLGMMLMVSANDLMALYVSIELMSLSLYVMASFARDSAKSSEAGLKYFVLGALASGMLLFGASLIYGFAGTTSFNLIAQLISSYSPDSFAEEASVSRGVVLGLIFLVVGFCFKISAVPFHMWTPDVYEGAPTPVTAFFATAPKVAGFGLFLRFMMQPFGDLFESWHQIIVFVSVGSMAVGAFGALMQTNIKRLLAYSSIGHVGFMLMGLAAGNSAGMEGILIYLVLYVFMNAGAFGCVLLMRRGGAYVEDIKQLAGLSRTRPLLAFILAAFMFSMAGIPPLAGFFGKLYVVLGVVASGQIKLAVIGIIASVVACYYYLKIVKIMYFDEAAQPFDAGVPASTMVCLGLSAFVTLFFFVAPHPLLIQAKAAVKSLLS